MPMNYEKPPEDVLRDSASEVRALSALPDDGVGGAGGSILSAQALPLFSMPIETLAKGGATPLDNATRQGWRMIMDDGGTDKLVDHIDKVGVASISGGRALEGLKGAGAKAAEMISGDDVDYETRVLDFGRLGRSALWLHAPNAQDRFFTIGGDSEEIAEDTFMSDVVGRAQARVKSMTPRDWGGGAVDGSTQDAAPDDVGG